MLSHPHTAYTCCRAKSRYPNPNPDQPDFITPDPWPHLSHSTSRKALFNKVLLHVKVVKHMLKLLQSTSTIIHVHFRLLNKQSRIVLARKPDTMADLELVWHFNDLSTAKPVLEELTRDGIGAIGQGVHDLASPVVLQAIVLAVFAVVFAAAIGYLAGIGE